MISQEEYDVMVEPCRCLAGARILFAGGTGFVGQWVLRAIKEANRRHGLRIAVEILSRNPHQFALKNKDLFDHGMFSLTAADITGRINLQEGFTHVIHGASDAKKDITDNRPADLISSLTTGTDNIMKLAARNKAKVLLLSSGAVKHGGHNAYSNGKRASEAICHAYHVQHGLDVNIARMYAFSGQWMPIDTHFAIGNFVRNLLRNETIEIKSDGTPVRSYMHGADMAAWLLRMMAEPVGFDIMDVGSSEEVMIGELAAMIASRSNEGARWRFGTKQDGVSNYYVADTKKAEMKGFKSAFTLDYSIDKMIEFWRNNA